MTQEFQKALAAKRLFEKNRVEEKSKTDCSDKVYYVNHDVTGASNTISLIDANTKKIPGLTNFDGNVIGLGKRFPISAMRVLYTVDGTKPGNANWQDRAYLPAELQNAILTLKQGKNILASLPLTDLQGFKMKEFRALATVPVLADKTPFELEIEMPNGIQLPVKAGTLSFLRIEFKGVEFKSN